MPPKQPPQHVRGAILLDEAQKFPLRLETADDINMNRFTVDGSVLTQKMEVKAVVLSGFQFPRTGGFASQS